MYAGGALSIKANGQWLCLARADDVNGLSALGPLGQRPHRRSTHGAGGVTVVREMASWSGVPIAMHFESVCRVFRALPFRLLRCPGRDEGDSWGLV